MEALNSFYCNTNVVIDAPSVDDSSAQGNISSVQNHVSVNDSIMYQNFYDLVRNFHLEQHNLSDDLTSKERNHTTKLCDANAGKIELADDNCTRKDLKKVVETRKKRAYSVSSQGSSYSSFPEWEDEESFMKASPVKKTTEQRVNKREKGVRTAVTSKTQFINYKKNSHDLNPELKSERKIGEDILKYKNNDDDDKGLLEKVNFSVKEKRKEGKITHGKLNRDRQKRSFESFNQLLSPSMMKECIARINTHFFPNRRKYLDRVEWTNLLYKKHNGIDHAESKELIDVSCDNLTLEEEWERNLDSGTDDVSDLDSLASDDYDEFNGERDTNTSINYNGKYLYDQLHVSKNRGMHPISRQYKKRKAIAISQNTTDCNSSNDGKSISEISIFKARKFNSTKKMDKRPLINRTIHTIKEEVKSCNIGDDADYFQSLVPTTTQYTIDISSPICSTTAENTPLGVNIATSRYSSAKSEVPCSQFTSPVNTCNFPQTKNQDVSKNKILENSKCNLWNNFVLG